MPVCTVRPFHSMSRGRPRFTDSSRAMSPAQVGPLECGSTSVVFQIKCYAADKLGAMGRCHGTYEPNHIEIPQGIMAGHYMPLTPRTQLGLAFVALLTNLS